MKILSYIWNKISSPFLLYRIKRLREIALSRPQAEILDSRYMTSRRIGNLSGESTDFFKLQSSKAERLFFRFRTP